MDLERKGAKETENEHRISALHYHLSYKQFCIYTMEVKENFEINVLYVDMNINLRPFCLATVE
jgi:hypothetical protein